MHFTVMNKLCASGVENFERYQIIKVKYTRGLVGVVAAGACCPGKFNTSTTVVRTAKSFALKSNLPSEKRSSLFHFYLTKIDLCFVYYFFYNILRQIVNWIVHHARKGNGLVYYV